MSKKMYLIAALLMVGTSCYGQTEFNYKRDYKLILEQTKDSTSRLAYDVLLARFKANDTTMTDYEVLALLIGFTAKEDFKPYGDLGNETAIYSLNEKRKYRNALDTASAFLEKHPLSQQAIIEKSYSFEQLGYDDSSKHYRYQFTRIMKAMEFSGDGRKKPMFALGPADGQNYITIYLGQEIGIMGSGSDADGNFMDMLDVHPSDGAPSYTLKFIIQHAMDRMFPTD